MAENKAQNNTNMNASEVLLRPRLTEKAINLNEKNVYVFEVSKRSNKVMVAKAVNDVYKVTPIKVAIVNTKPKKKRSQKTGKIGKTRIVKKAYVYLKKGDSISIM